MLLNGLKRALLGLGILSVTLQAGLVNAISVTVNDEPITLYEIHKLSNVQSLSLRDALDRLIQERLEESQIKRLGIKADAYEVQSRVESIATQNGITIMELRNFITSKGMSWDGYSEEIEKSIKQEKLYSRIFSNSISPFDAAQIRAYYDNNIDEFKRANRVSVIRYDAPNEEVLKQIVASPMSVIPSVNTTQEILTASEQEQRLQYYLDQTSVGSFTPIIQSPAGARMYLVESKNDIKIIPFERVESAIANRLEEERRNETIRNYFEKLKARADIVILRRP